MNTSTIAIICGAAIASAGVTYYVTSATPEPLAPDQDSQATPSPNQKNKVSTPSAPSQKIETTQPDKDPSTPSNSAKSISVKPDGIDDETWKKALERAQGIAMFANRARESGWMERMVNQRVERDTKTITEKLELEGEESEKMQALLASRAEATTEKGKKVFDAMLSNEEGLATLLAIREMNQNGTEITPGLETTKETYKKEMFGEFYPENGQMSDDDIMKLFRPSRPESWYKDDEFLVSASSELGGEQGASLVDYAGKLDYLDRQDDAYNKVNRIERTVDLQPQQSKALKQLYIENKNPTDDQISQIVGADKVEAIKSSSQSRRRWGRGGRRR